MGKDQIDNSFSIVCEAVNGLPACLGKEKEGNAMFGFGGGLSAGVVARWCTMVKQYHEAGFTLVQVCQKLGQRGPAGSKEFSSHLANHMAAGESLKDSLATWKGKLPSLVIPMLEAGEATGRLVDALDALAASLGRQAKSQADLVRRCTWPLLQLVLACGILILLTVVIGLLPGAKASGFDPLGFGMTGVSGGLKLLLYVLVVGGGLAAGGYWLWRSRDSAIWLKFPMVGHARQLLARARFGEGLGMTVGAGLGPRKALALAVRGADLGPWTVRVQEGQIRLRSGDSWQKVLGDWPYLGADWLGILAVGEESGELSEALLRQALLDNEEGSAYLARSVSAGAGAAWFLSAGVVVFMIFRLFSAYIGALGL